DTERRPGKRVEERIDLPAARNDREEPAVGEKRLTRTEGQFVDRRKHELVRRIEVLHASVQIPVLRYRDRPRPPICGFGVDVVRIDLKPIYHPAIDAEL